MISDREAINCDVLVAGGGLAACRAAIRARELGADVVLIDKGYVSRSGATAFAHVMLAPPPQRSAEYEAWFREMVEDSQYLADQDWIEAILNEHSQRVKELEELGVEFERTPGGDFNRTIARGQKVGRSIHFDGAKLLESLRAAMVKKGVRVIDRVMLTHLLTSDGFQPTGGRVVGAAGLHTRTGRFIVFPAKAVVLGTGPFTSDSNLNYIDNCTGEGTVAAYQAGAELMEMEFGQHGSISYFGGKLKVIGQSKLQGHGTKIVNRLGERIMEMYDPDLKELTNLGLIAQAVTKENLEGRGPCYFDMRHVSEEHIQHLRRVLPVLMRGFDNVGLDIRKQLVECAPLCGVMATSSGAGIRVNTACQTAVPGLYACGNATKPPHGAGNIAPVPQSYASLSGYRAGENAAREAHRTGMPVVSDKQVRELEAADRSPLDRKSGVKGGDVVYELLKTIAPARYSLFRREDRIKESLARVRDIRANLLPEVSGQDVHGLVKAIGAGSVAQTVELVLLSALERTECRGPHYREDYPYRDDINWLRWVVVRNIAGRPHVGVTPVPLEKYPVKPPARKRIPHPVQIRL
ncbi:MAG: FAD-binding protein [Chloroflexi bacterium]|nr:FAD-binding protein [Chloroflexota bacterium]